MCDGSNGRVSMLGGFYNNTFDGDTFDSGYIRIEGIEDGNLNVTVRKGQPIWAEQTGENEAEDIAGSEAYYRLAEQIRGEVSFAVIEPYNLYHPEDVRRGIRAIAANYIEILKRFQPGGPYLLGGWCYGGVVAHEMACQLERAGEQVQHLFLLDSHALDSQELVSLSRSMRWDMNRDYYETSPLFAELRQEGMLEAVLRNAGQVAQDMREHRPSMYRGAVTYFKPCQIPAGVSGESRRYWETMMRFSAGNYERYFLKEKARIVLTPDEHDLMMERSTLDIIVPEIRKALRL